MSLYPIYNPSLNKKFDIDGIHNEIRALAYNHKRKYQESPEFLILSIDLWFDIKAQSKDVIPPEHRPKTDGCWYIYGMKIAMLDGSCAQSRTIKVG